jgi:hypothetical protein
MGVIGRLIGLGRCWPTLAFPQTSKPYFGRQKATATEHSTIAIVFRKRQKVSAGIDHETLESYDYKLRFLLKAVFNYKYNAGFSQFLDYKAYFLSSPSTTNNGQWSKLSILYCTFTVAYQTIKEM